MMLNNFLSSYFIYDQFESEQKWNFRFILNKLSFNSKICIFSKIKFHLKKKFRKRYEGLDKCLDEIRKTRNLVAHAIQAHFTEPILKTEKRERLT
ncbi:MAG: Abi family protein [Elusimicrobia bacterium]|nr:Abi family protein [Elusimicrobiota bacterium]